MVRVLPLLLFLWFASAANQVKRLLVLEALPAKPYSVVTEALLVELEKRGYHQGKNLYVERHLLGNYEGRGISTLRARIDSNFHVILLNGTVAGIAAVKFKSKTSGFPSRDNQFVFVNITDPVGIGLVAQLQKPTTGNFTGIAYPVKLEERLRLVQKYFGKGARVGFIYSEMPQSLSYRRWLDQLLSRPEFRPLHFHFRTVPFIQSDGGIERMAMIAETFIKELDPQVDVFLSPNDQLGVSNEFGSRVIRNTTKPLVGLADEVGSAIALTPDLEQMGKDAAAMIIGIFEGKQARDFVPRNSTPKLVRNKKIRIPNPQK